MNESVQSERLRANAYGVATESVAIFNINMMYGDEQSESLAKRQYEGSVNKQGESEGGLSNR